MILGIARRLRAVLRQVRAAMRLAGVALDRRGELGWREIADRTRRRLAGRSSAPETAPTALARSPTRLRALRRKKNVITARAETVRAVPIDMAMVARMP